MPFDPETLVPIVATMFLGASTLLFTAAIAWRVALRPTMRALLEYRTARAGSEPLRRLSELEDEVRSMKAQLAPLGEVSLGRPQPELPWHPRRERA